MTKKITVVAGKDELGEPEEFTWDLFAVVDPAKTLHLDEHGLPKVGTRITPGMVLVGKIGQTRSFDQSRQPNALELHGLSFDELRSRYGGMWYDASIYANDETAGIIEHASLETVRGQQVAVVLINIEAFRPDLSFSLPADHPTVEA